MKQTKEQLENWYEQNDPWGYRNHEDDTRRKEKVLSVLQGTFKKALDLGCGEGFITKDLPAKEIYGYEISDKATERLPENVTRILVPKGKYDLIIATGVMYEQYDAQHFIDIIKKHANGIVVLSNIADLEVPEVTELGTPIHEEEYKYRDYIQKLRVYDFTPQRRTRKSQ